MFDSHCHLADEAFQSDREAVVRRAREAGLHGALCIVDAGEPRELQVARELAAAWPAVRFAVGIHPHQAVAYDTRVSEIVPMVEQALAELPRASAVGEIGLDYHYDFSPRPVQQEVLRVQLAIARDRRLPIVVHARLSERDVLAVVDEVGRGAVGGVFHCYTGGVDLARRVVDAGFHLGFGGIVTFPRAHDVREVARQVPLDRVLIETDCPYLAPVPHRGKRNEPAWVTYVAETLATIHGVSVLELVEMTSRNFERLFGPVGA